MMMMLLVVTDIEEDLSGTHTPLLSKPQCAESKLAARSHTSCTVFNRTRNVYLSFRRAPTCEFYLTTTTDDL